jgi:hypothetical protein
MLGLRMRDTDATAEIGSQAVLVGAVLNSSDVEGDDFKLGYPTADYVVDGISCELLIESTP